MKHEFKKSKDFPACRVCEYKKDNPIHAVEPTPSSCKCRDLVFSESKQEVVCDCDKHLLHSDCQPTECKCVPDRYGKYPYNCPLHKRGQPTEALSDDAKQSIKRFWKGDASQPTECKCVPDRYGKYPYNCPLHKRGQPTEALSDDAKQSIKRFWKGDASQPTEKENNDYLEREVIKEMMATEKHIEQKQQKTNISKGYRVFDKKHHTAYDIYKGREEINKLLGIKKCTFKGCDEKAMHFHKSTENYTHPTDAGIMDLKTKTAMPYKATEKPTYPPCKACGSTRHKVDTEKPMDWEKDLEYILTEWEGKTNPLIGAIRVTSRMKTLKSYIKDLLKEERETPPPSFPVKCNICGAVWAVYDVNSNGSICPLQDTHKPIGVSSNQSKSSKDVTPNLAEYKQKLIERIKGMQKVVHKKTGCPDCDFNQALDEVEAVIKEV